MITKLRWIRNKDVFSKLSHMDGIEPLIDKTCELVEIDFKEFNLIFSPNTNSMGKTIVIYSLQYVLGKSNNKNEIQLLKMINKALSKFNKKDKVFMSNENEFIFSYDIEIEFECPKEDICSLKRKILFDENEFFHDNSWIFKNGDKETKVEFKDLPRIIYPLIFKNWVERYGFKSFKSNSKDDVVVDVSLQKSSHLTMHEYLAFLSKTQMQGNNRRSAPQLFDFYIHWNEVSYDSLLYSIFSNNKKEGLSFLEIRKLIDQWEVNINELKSIEQENKLLNKVSSKVSGNNITKKSNNIDNDTIAKIKELKQDINELSEQLQPHLNDFFTNDSKLILNSDDLLGKIHKLDYRSIMNVEAKITLDKYNLKINELKKLWPKDKSDSGDAIIKQLILDSLFSTKDTSELKDVKLKNDKNLINAKRILEKETKEIKNILEGYDSESGANLNNSELKTLEKICELKEDELPLLIIDEFLDGVDSPDEKQKTLSRFNRLSHENFQQVFITTAKSNFKNYDNDDNSIHKLKIDSPLFVKEIKDDNIKQVWKVK